MGRGRTAASVFTWEKILTNELKKRDNERDARKGRDRPGE